MKRMGTQVFALVGAIALAAPAFAQTPDHLACYKVKDRSARATFTMTVTNGEASGTCTVKLPAKLVCFSTATSGIAPAPPGSGPSPGGAADFLCYTARCPRPAAPRGQATDTLGSQRVIHLQGSQLVCAPATVQQPSGATTTTTNPGPCGFDSGSRTCKGTCGNGGQCSGVASGGACECRTTSCGDASAPECSGFCARDEACIFSVTGCSCVTIP